MGCPVARNLWAVVFLAILVRSTVGIFLDFIWSEANAHLDFLYVSMLSERCDTAQRSVIGVTSPSCRASCFGGRASARRGRRPCHLAFEDRMSPYSPDSERPLSLAPSRPFGGSPS